MSRWSEKDVAWATQMSVSRLESTAKRVKAALEDKEAGTRSAHLECATCFYLVRPTKIVGHSFTDFECQRCGAPGVHHNTGVPKLCQTCAVAAGLCVRCGGLLEPKTEPEPTREG